MSVPETVTMDIEKIDKEIAELQAQRDALRARLVAAWKRRDGIIKESELAKDLKMMRDKHGVDFAPTQDLHVGGIASKPAVGAAKT